MDALQILKKNMRLRFSAGSLSDIQGKKLRTILHSVTCTKVGHTLCFMSEQQDSHVQC